jgi:2-polyprenyl-3-methyl-5-hydroxy-6-metoxy-1,4-benzoquinol methylase
MAEACPVCKASDTYIKYAFGDYAIARCRVCDLDFHDAFGGGGGEQDTFSEDYYKNVQGPAFEQQFGDYTRDPSAPVYSRWLEIIKARVGPGHILDVGCALGTFLKIAESKGFAPEGVEISRFAATFAREKRGLTVFNGDLEAFPAVAGSFDVVTFWDSIEHVTHPLENLQTAHRLLRPGGLVLLTTDNFDCLVADVGRLMYHATFGAVKYGMRRVYIPPNRTYFTEATFRDLMRRTGFRVVEFEKMEYPLDKIRTNAMERLILRSFYAAAKVLGRQAQITVVAEKT